MITSASRSEPSLKREAPPARVRLDPRQCCAGADLDAVLPEPRLDERCPLAVDHARQDLRRDLDDGEPRAQREDRIEDGEGDEAGAHHHDVAARPDLGEDAAGLLERPEAVHPGAVGARDGSPDGGRPRRDEEIVVLEHRLVVERELPGLCVEPRRPAPDVTGHAQPAKLRGRRREDVGLGNGATEIVREDHPRVGPLRRDQDDLRALALLLPDRVDRVVTGGAAPDDDVARRHQCLPFPPAGTSVPAARAAAKSPSQSTVSVSS